MINELADVAKSKDANPTEYVSARLGSFLQMRSENPDMTIEEMNEQMALDSIFNISLNTLIPTVSELLYTDINSFEELIAAQDYECIPKRWRNNL